jgi:hypothetical protein
MSARRRRVWAVVKVAEKDGRPVPRSERAPVVKGLLLEEAMRGAKAVPGMAVRDALACGWLAAPGLAAR